MPKKNGFNPLTVCLLVITLLLPLLIIPFINNPLIRSKGILVFLAAIITVFTYLIGSLKKKKWQFAVTPLVLPSILFGIAILLSSLITHQYPTGQFLGWSGIYLSWMLLVLFAPTLISQKAAKSLVSVLNLAGAILALSSILQLTGIGFAQLINRLSIFEFQNNLAFSLSGSAFVNVQLLSSVLIANLLVKKQRESLGQKAILALLLVGLGINIYAILPKQVANFISLPLAASVSIARQSLATSRTALFGFGPNSFNNAYNLLKPVWINGQDYWQFTFDSATSFPLTIVVSGGILALLSWLMLVSRSVATFFNKKNDEAAALKYFALSAFAWQIIAPANFVMVGLLAIALAFYLAANINSFRIKTFSFNNFFDPLNLRPNNKANAYSFTFASALLIVISAFFTFELGRSYLAQVRLYQANSAVAAEDLNAAYTKQGQARNLANRSDFIRRSYAMSNLEIAIALSNKTDITPAEQEQVLQLVNQAITEAKAATLLEPQNYQNWLALAEIYLQLTDVTDDAKQQAFDALASAVVNNPNNPELRMRLGQFFFGMEQYADSITFFSQAVERKPDMTTAYYALGKALEANEQIVDAQAALNRTLSLIDKEANPEDYARVKQDLEPIDEQVEELKAQYEAEMKKQQAAQQQAIQKEADAEETASGDSNLSKLLDENSTEEMILDSTLESPQETLE